MPLLVVEGDRAFPPPCLGGRDWEATGSGSPCWPGPAWGGEQDW